jgi:cyanobactin biosynthesis protein (PatB/AcyB/McaB family)
MPTNPKPGPKRGPSAKPAAKAKPAGGAAKPPAGAAAHAAGAAAQAAGAPARTGAQSLMPAQVAPVKRPPDLVRPEEFMDPTTGTPHQQATVRALLSFDTNYNDPGVYDVPSYARMLGSALRA